MQRVQGLLGVSRSEKLGQANGGQLKSALALSIPGRNTV